jgi:EAL domain-containing protein (putative c-di-GMP-specific phosphodiesterase class I)
VEGPHERAIEASTATAQVHDRAVVTRALDGHLTAAYQPIVNLVRNQVIGYEALLRYRGDDGRATTVFSTRELLAAARRVGRLAEMEAAALREALRAHDELPHQCFLALNVSVESLADERVAAPLLEYGSLEGIVLELPHHGLESLPDARDALDRLRDRGASVAVGEPVLDPAMLTELLQLEPGYLKLTHELVAGIARSRSKLAIVASLRQLAEHLDMGVIAQGIEQLADLRSLERLGVELGQGYLLARPATSSRFLTSLPSLDAMRERNTDDGMRIRSMLEPVAELTEEQLDSPLPDTGDISYEVIVSELHEPLAVLRRKGRRVESLPLTIIDVHTSPKAAAITALQRPENARFEPMVCVDEMGTCVGVLRVDRLMKELARQQPAEATPHLGDRPAARRSGRHPRH